MALKYAYTEWGLQVHVFCGRHGLTKKELAQMAGIPYSTLKAVSQGDRPGYEAKERVNEVMQNYGGGEIKEEGRKRLAR